jgi:hypothetical protein
MEGYQQHSGDNDTNTLDVSSVSPNKRKLSPGVSVSPQADALKTIYESLGGPDWARQDNWLSEDHDCFEWQGITCSKGTGDEITVLELSQNNLRGRLDNPILVEAFVKLGPTLEQLWLSENAAITGNLPPIFADASVFPKLSVLDVMNNQLSGSLHPAFAKRAKQMSCLDFSGNQLTSYYRYTSTSTNNNNDHDADEVYDVGPMSSPLPHVHVAQSLLTKEQCADLVDLAIRHSEANGGWMMGRKVNEIPKVVGAPDSNDRNASHNAYKTTDVDISICGGKLLDTCNDHLRTIILPLMARLFGISICDLVIENLFLAKYSASRGQPSALPEHLDDSELSFVVTLNDSFQGGGTRFIADDTGTTVAPQGGAGVFFCGCRLHSGVEVVEGNRYILAGFVRVYSSTPEGVAKLDSLLKQTSQPTNLQTKASSQTKR